MQFYIGNSFRSVNTPKLTMGHTWLILSVFKHNYCLFWSRLEFRVLAFVIVVVGLMFLSGCGKNEEHPNEPRDFFGRTGGDVVINPPSDAH